MFKNMKQAAGMLENFVSKLGQTYTPEQCSVLTAVMYLKAGMELGQGSVDMRDHVNVSAFAHIISKATESVGLSGGQTAAALNSFVQVMQEAHEVVEGKSEKEEPVIPSEALANYLANLAGNAKH